MAAAETRSFKRAHVVVRDVGDQPISAKTIERVTNDVGHELVERRDADPRSDRSANDIANKSGFLDRLISRKHLRPAYGEGWRRP